MNTSITKVLYNLIFFPVACFTIIALHLSRFLLRLPRGIKAGVNEKILVEFLKFDHAVRRQTIGRLGIPIFNNVHPKNIFNYRSEFFISHLSKEDVVLDLGCGTGLLIKDLFSKVKQVIGIDWDEKTLMNARRQVNKSNVQFITGNILDYNLEPFFLENGVTVTILSHVLEHIEDPVAFIKKIRSSKLLVCVPSQENWLAALKKHYRLEYLTDPTHFREYTRDPLINHLNEGGFRVDIIGFNGEGEIVCKAIRE